jgi:HPt (histidine-containing phosphotransfer) domain-containing protein
LLDAPRRLARVERRLVELGAGNPASDRSTAIADAALEAHSLRGAAGTLQLEALGELAESLELTLREVGANGDDGALLDRARELVGSIAS